MKVLVLTQAIVECCNGKYYCNVLNAFIPRYTRFSQNIILMVAEIKENEQPSEDLIDLEYVNLVVVGKINTLKALLEDRRRIRPIINSYVEWADCCMIHLPDTVGNMVAKYAEDTHTPYLLTVAGCVWDAYWNYNWKGKLFAPYAFWTLRKTISKAKYVVYVTNTFLQRRYPTKGQYISCSNVKQDRTTIDILDQRLVKISERKNQKLALGTLAAVDVRYKGQEYVIRAIAKLAQSGFLCEYHIAGLGNNSFLKDLAKRLNVSSQVIFYGGIPHEKVASFFDKIDIYIQPSKQEGLPRAVIEAMSRGCPTIGSRIAGIPELLDESCLFNKGNVDEICSLLLSYDNVRMKKEAVRNYEEAQKYELSILNERRNAFFDYFLRDNNLIVEEKKVE